MKKLSLALAPLTLAAFSVHATPLVEASSSSMAQGGAQPVSSYAKVKDGALSADPLDNFAAPNGTSSAGPIGQNVTSAFANTTQNDGGVATSASASADLATGSLRNRVDAGPSSGPGASTGIANSHWRETVTFNNVSGAVVEMPFFWKTSGLVTDSNGSSLGYQRITSSIYLVDPVNASSITFKDNNLNTGGLGGAAFNYECSGPNNCGTYFQFPPSGNNLEGAWTTILTDPYSAILSATLLVPVGLATIDIDAFLLLDCRTGAVCDYANTAKFEFGALPNGLTWSSASGVFLTGNVTTPPPSVPEPGTLALLALSLAGLGLSRRRSN